MTTSTAEKPRALKSAQELEVERLQALDPESLTHEDLRKLKAIRTAREHVFNVKKELEAIKERVKLSEEALEEAVAAACDHSHARQLAMEFAR